MTEPLRAAIYARRSLEQRGVAEEAKSVALQERGARAFILSQGWTLDDTHVYRDDGVSGALWLGRPQFQRMLVDAGADAFDVIVFYKLDRFGRDARKTPVALYGLAELGIKIVPDYTTGEFLDLDTPEGRLKMQFGVELGQGERTNIRKRVRDFAHARVAGGYVAGGGVYGYDIVGTKGTKKRVVNKAQAAVVVDIYTRFSRGDGPYQIAQALNAEGVPSPRKKKDGRTHGWSVTPVRAMLSRPIYRGWIVYGRTGMAYGSELGKKRSSEEKGQIKKPESEWLRVEAQELRIIEPELSARVDAMLTERHSRYLAAREKGSKQRNTEPHGKHLLSGGMLLCPTCDGHFEADQNKRNYVCSVRRRKGRDVCTNELRLPIQETDEQVLSVLAKENGEIRSLEEYLSHLGDASTDPTVHLTAERERLLAEKKRLVESIAVGVPAETVAPAIKEREADIKRVEEKLRQPRPVMPDREKLRAVLEQKVASWKADLRAELPIARRIVRDLIYPIMLWDPHADEQGSDEWDADDEEGWPEGFRAEDGYPRTANRLLTEGIEFVYRKGVDWKAEAKPDELLRGLVPPSFTKR